MYKGQTIILLSIPWNSHVLDTGEINWAVWKLFTAAGGQQLHYGNVCSQRQRKALQDSNSFWICPFSTFLSSPRSHSSLCTCCGEEGGSVELIFLSSSGPNHPNSCPCWNLLPTFPVKQGNFFSFANEAFIRTVARARIFQQRKIGISYVHFLCEHRYITAQPGLLLCEVIYISVCRTGAKISQHWCYISTHFVLGSSCESPVGAVQRYLKGWYFCNYLIIAPRFFLVLVKPSFQWKCNPTLLNSDKMWLRTNINSPVVFGVGAVILLSLFPVWEHQKFRLDHSE